MDPPSDSRSPGSGDADSSGGSGSSGDAGYPGRTRALFARYRGGDVEAGAELFREHGEFLLQVVRRRLPRSLRRRVDPEDVVGDVFRRALNGPLAQAEWRDETPGGLKKLLAHIARGVIVDLARYHGAGVRGERVVSLDPKTGGGDGAGPAVRSFDASQSSEASYRELLALGHEVLSEREWELFEAVFVQGRSAAEVARSHGATPEAVRGVLFRARQKLIARLAEGEGEEGA